MDEPLDILPREGERKLIRMAYLRAECDVCGNKAKYKHTFLLEGARSNPASSAYRKDDCSWCEDDHRFVCEQHKDDRTEPDGYRWCSTFPATERFAHMFMRWTEVME